MTLVIPIKKSYDVDIELECIGELNGLEVYFVTTSLDLGGAKTGKCELYVKDFEINCESAECASKKLAEGSVLDSCLCYSYFEDGDKSRICYLRLPDSEENKMIKDFVDSKR